MNCFPDTSFLCATYRTQTHSPKADAFMAKLIGPLPVSTFLLLEFRQSLRLQARLNAQDKTRGFPKHQAVLMLRDLQSDLAAKVLEVVPVDWADVHQIADRLSAAHTEKNGHRLADIMHVATALHLGATQFLTFDANQQQLAEAEGLDVKW
ncbi:MAG: type II toxin-antitoxin system VapC family toxin [Verrucomicrobia bacterium]|nr:type II toxin-antitoxin system VapC family toxin [Verrucomicrobiota bacterium]